MSYTANNTLLKRKKQAKKEAIKSWIVGNLMNIFMILLMYFNLGYPAVFVGFLNYFAALVVFNLSGIIILSRAHRTIKEISINDQNIEFQLSSIFWYKSDKIVIPIDKLRMKEQVFIWCHKTKKENYSGTALKQKFKSKEYFLIKDFFDDYHTIIEQLQNKIDSD